MNAHSRLAGADRWFAPLLAFDVIAALAMAAVMWAALLYAGDAINLAGDEQVAQRIFYFHMGSNIAALLGFLGSVVGSLGYLFSRRLEWGSLGCGGALKLARYSELSCFCQGQSGPNLHGTHIGHGIHA